MCFLGSLDGRRLLQSFVSYPAFLKNWLVQILKAVWKKMSSLFMSSRPILNIATPHYEIFKKVKLQKFSKRSLLFEALFFFLHFLAITNIFLPYVPNHRFESWLHPFHCWFPIDFSLFHLHFLLGLFYVVAELSEFLKYPNHQYFELCI